MSVSKLSRRALGALAATSLLVGLLPTAATAATPEPRDITKFACPSGEVPDPGFSDDENTTAEHKASIACVVWYELAAGRTTTTYAPGDAVNRGQMATFIGNLLVKGGVTLSDNPPDAFADDDNTQHEKRINQLAELGVVEGDREGKYNAGFPVTRAQMASFLNRAYQEITGAALTSSEDYFTDDEGAFHEKNINAVAGAGIAAGTSSTTYAPGKAVKRDQMATFLARETDLLVEKGEISKPVVKDADVILAASSVKQGGKLAGRVEEREGVEITSAKVSGCSLQEQAITLTGEDNTFEITIPVTQPATTCTLGFTIGQRDGDDIVDVESIMVLPIGSLTDAPELASVSASQQSDETYKVVFTFDEALNAAPGAADPQGFRLYTTAADERFPQGEVTVSGSSVTATFSKADYDAATTAVVSYAAVEDASNLPNPEGAKPLQGRTNVADTLAPDLTSVKKKSETPKSETEAATATYTFTFDATAFDVGDATKYHLVFTDGSRASGTSFESTTPTTGQAHRDVVFTDSPEGSVVGKVLARGYVDAGAVSNAAQDENPATTEGQTNPLQAVHYAPDNRPHLQSIAIDAAANTVTYHFHIGVDIEGEDTIVAGVATNKFVAYGKDGEQVSSSRATKASNNAVVATFTSTDNSDPITADTLGAGALEDAVTGTVGGRFNRADELSEGQKFDAGSTAAPDLLSVTRSASGPNSVITFTFDQPVSQNQSQEGLSQRFTIYQADGTRRELNFNSPSTSHACVADGAAVSCSAPTSSSTGQAIDSATLAGVEARTVDDPNNDTYKNYDASAPILE